jgi:hypothetical protein
LQTCRPSGQVVGVPAQVNVQPRQEQGVADWQVNAQPPSHSAVQLPPLQLMVLPAPSVKAQVELEHWTSVLGPAAMVQLPLLQSTLPSRPRVAVQVELEQLTRQESPQLWEHALVELQLRPQSRSQA